jgi:hypothetical protein
MFEFMNYFHCKLVVTLGACRDTMYDIWKGFIILTKMQCKIFGIKFDITFKYKIL